VTDSIIPSPELVTNWILESDIPSEDMYEGIATRAAQWGADQELEACLANIHTMYGKNKADCLRAMRRPKPPSLKEQALLQLDTLNADLGLEGKGVDLSQIRRALEALPE
jgi:hypothetical protein